MAAKSVQVASLLVGLLWSAQARAELRISGDRERADRSIVNSRIGPS
jgi:hypothetical protein